MSDDDFCKVEDGYTILSHACMNGQQMLVSQMLSHPTAPMLIQKGLVYPLWLAANEGHSEVVHLLLYSNICPKKEVMRKATDGTTPVMIAMLREHAGVLSLLRHCDQEYFNRLKKELNDKEPQGLKAAQSTRLVDLSKEFPSFNDDIEIIMDKAMAKGKSRIKQVEEYREEQRRNPTKDTSRQPPMLTYASAVPNFQEIMSAKFRKEKGLLTHLRDPEIPSENIDLKKDVEPNFLKPFCCLRKVNGDEAIDVSKVVTETFSECQTDCKQ